MLPVLSRSAGNRFHAISAKIERLDRTQQVTGSIPASFTEHSAGRSAYPVGRHIGGTGRTVVWLAALFGLLAVLAVLGGGLSAWAAWRQP
jgi:hypothetical protein